MRTIYWTARRLIAARLVFIPLGLLWIDVAMAQSVLRNNETYFSSTTITHGLYLPSATLPHGADEVRAGDGTTCRSSLAGNAGYLDFGAVGNQDPGRDTLSAGVYGRVIVPLGRKPARMDCRALYDLEVRRLRHELDLARMGASAISPVNGANGGKVQPWEKEGWHDHRVSDRKWKKGTSVQPN